MVVQSALIGDLVDRAVRGKGVQLTAHALDALWERDEAYNLVETLATSPRLTIVVGAGASVEVGAPTWVKLVTDLLAGLGRYSSTPNETLDLFCEWVLKSAGVTGGGAIVKAFLNDRQLKDELKDLLYSSDAIAEGQLPGPTAIAVARLKYLWGDKCEIVTTNYDDLLERALVEEGESETPKVKLRDVKAIVTGQDASGLFVRHLHGVLRRNGRSVGKVVLSEEDYHVMQDERSWQEKFFLDRLKKSTCLFVGMSMTDPNILRYLYRTSSNRPHTAIIVRQGDPKPPGATDDVRLAYEAVNSSRWKAMGVEPLYVDYFVQSAQLLWEVAYRRELGSTFPRYRDRMHTWEEEVEASLLKRSDLVTFRETQDDLQELFAKLKDEIAGLLKDAGFLDSNERLGLHLWVRNWTTRSLVLWAGSDRSWKDPDTLHNVRVDRPTEMIAVDAFRRGTIIEYEPTDSSDTKWRFVMAIPIFLTNKNWGRLPVGVVTLASGMDKEQSRMAKAQGAVKVNVTRVVIEAIEQLLDPKAP